MSKSNIYLASKPRYEILDGLRGVAAMLVVAYHFFVAVCIFVLAILVAYGAYKLYDLPVREWLKKKCFNIQK